jgi:hypothetical protein
VWFFKEKIRTPHAQVVSGIRASQSNGGKKPLKGKTEPIVHTDAKRHWF